MYFLVLFISFIFFFQKIILVYYIIKNLVPFSCSLVCPHIALSFLVHPHISFYYVYCSIDKKRLYSLSKLCVCLFVILHLACPLIHPTLGSSHGSSFGVSHIVLSPHKLNNALVLVLYIVPLSLCFRFLYQNCVFVCLSSLHCFIL